MRGSIYFQSTQLIKTIFREGAKKCNRVNEFDKDFNCLASYETAATYRRVWENFFKYLREHYALKNVELIVSDHIKSYMLSKIKNHSSLQYFKKINSAIGKLEFALNEYSLQKYNERKIVYDFSIRNEIYTLVKEYDLISSSYRNRAYKNPDIIIENLHTNEFKIAAKIQLSGGCRFEGVGLIKLEQLKAITFDEFTKQKVGNLTTKEKGGKVSDVKVSIEVFSELREYIIQNKVFKIDYQKYVNEIRIVCEELNIKSEGTHAFRWNFAQRRMVELQNRYSYDSSLQELSYEMKHNRKDISLHYGSY